MSNDAHWQFHSFWIKEKVFPVKENETIIITSFQNLGHISF